MAKPTFDADRARRVVIDAIDFGDRQACETWNVAPRTLRSYKERLRSDPELAKVRRDKKRDEAEEWHAKRRQLLAAGIDKCRELLDQATIAHLRDVVGMLKVVGELEQTDKVLLADVDRESDRESQATSEVAGELSEVEFESAGSTIQ